MSSPIIASIFSVLKVTSLPTIFAANSSGFVTLTFKESITFPLLIMVTESAIAIISFNLCVIRIIDLPSSTKFCIITASSSISCGVNTAVGSSKIKILAPRYNVLSISTLCCIPTDISSILASGSTYKPYFLESSITI